VLIWGRSTRLGSNAIQLAVAVGYLLRSSSATFLLDRRREDQVYLDSSLKDDELGRRDPWRLRTAGAYAFAPPALVGRFN
jgi:hypothetical protein